MMLQTYAESAVLNRLEKLEKQSRRMKLAGAVAMVFAASIVLMGQAPAFRTVEANAFILRDMNGKFRGQFSTGGTGQPFLSLLDESGKERVELSVNPFGATLLFKDDNGRVRASLSPILHGSFGFSLHDPSGKSRFVLLANSDGAQLTFLDPSEKMRSTLFSQSNGLVTLAFLGEDQKPRTSLSEASLLVSDKEGFTTTIGTTDLTIPRTGEARRRSAASVMLSDKDGKVLWQAP